MCVIFYIRLLKLESNYIELCITKTYGVIILSKKKQLNNVVPISTLCIYSIFFYPIWAVYHFFIEPLLMKIPNEALYTFVGDGIIKSLIWVLPAIILINKYKDKLSFNLKEMFSFTKESVKYLWVFAAFFVYIIIGILVRGGTISINNSFGLDDIIVVLFVGVTEEIVFRGWLLNATLKRNENIAIAVNAVMFLAIHFPIWICTGTFITNFTSLGFISLIALSVIFSLVFIKTKSLILPITLHMFWDLIIFMLG